MAWNRPAAPTELTLLDYQMNLHLESDSVFAFADMKKIQLSTGGFALVDNADYEALNIHRWRAKVINHSTYAVRVSNGRMIYMHREILNDPQGKQIDHFDGNGLNNQRANLRPCTAQENKQNRRKFAQTSSRFKGVYWCQSSRRWRTRLCMNKKRVGYGSFRDEEAAAHHYDVLARQHFGEFARLNFPTA